MPRKRKHTQQDEGIFVPYPQHADLVVPAYKADVNITETEREKSVKLFNRMHHRVPAGYRDPMSAAFLLDLLQRWNPHYYVRAKYAAAALNTKQDALFFDPITVGKLIAELVEIGKETNEATPELTPLVTHADFKGKFFFINSVPQTYRWFWSIRKQLGKHIEEILDRESKGLAPARIDSAWDRIDFTDY